jgi:hexosaminidase
MKDIVDYASQRYITIVPEIDLPGHCMAALATYPHLGTESNADVKPAITWGIYNKLNNVLAPSEEAFAFLEDVFGELMDIFPGEYIHIGMDECCHRWWKESPKTQAFIKEHGLGDEKGLQKYFAQRVSAMVRARGRVAVGWDEMVDNGLEEGVALTVWRGGNRWVPAAQAGHKVIMTPNAKSYLNYKQRPDEKRLAHMFRLVALDTVYKFDPTPDTLSAAVLENVIGGQGCLWTEYFPTPQAVEYAIFPRLSAISEVYWTREDLKDYDRFLEGMPVQFARYALWGVEEPCRYIFESADLRGPEVKVARTAEDGD